MRILICKTALNQILGEVIPDDFVQHTLVTVIHFNFLPNSWTLPTLI